MKIDKITLISIVAIIFVFCMATVFAVSTFGNDTKMICVNKDGDCFINTTGNVIANNTTDKGNMLILEDNGERTVFAFFEIPGDNPTAFNGFIYNDGKPCYAYKMNDKYYCISIVKSSDSSHMTTDYLQKVLVLSNQWSQDVKVDNPVETDYIGEGLSLYDLYLGIWLQKIDIKSYNILFLGLYHGFLHNHNQDPGVNQEETATPDNGVVNLISNNKETNNTLDNSSNLANGNESNNNSQNSAYSPFMNMLTGNNNSSSNSSLDNNSEKAAGSLLSIGNNKQYTSDVSSAMDEQSKLSNKFDSDANSAEVSSSNAASKSNSPADTSSSNSESSTPTESTTANGNNNKSDPGLSISAKSSQATSSNDNVVVSIKLPSDATGKVVVKVDGKSQTVSASKNTVNLTVPTKNPHSVTVTFKGDTKYNSATTSTTA